LGNVFGKGFVIINDSPSDNIKSSRLSRVYPPTKRYDALNIQRFKVFPLVLGIFDNRLPCLWVDLGKSLLNMGVAPVDIGVLSVYMQAVAFEVE
jgi:hypothetical protein